MRAFYNDSDPRCCAWISTLMDAGHITPGVISDKSIQDIKPDDLKGFDRVHFFAGIAGWELALNIAGWGKMPVWTGSCPCPPFSAAGKGQQCPDCGSKSNICHPRKTGHFVCLDCGCDRYADDRHLWPEYSRLIRESDAPVTFGEQVASADGRLWLAAVRADLETMGRSAGGADLCAAGVGSPNIRQRLWFVTERGVAQGDAYQQGLEGWERAGERAAEFAVRKGSMVGRMADGSGAGWRPERAHGYTTHSIEPVRSRQAEFGRCGPTDERMADAHISARGQGGTLGAGSDHRGDALEGAGSGGDGFGGRLADTERFRRDRWQGISTGRQHERQDGGRVEDNDGPFCVGQARDDTRWPRPLDEFWRDADWLFCRDEQWRPVEPASFPLAHGVPARVVRLRGYGNAINPYAAAAFIRAYMESGPEIDLAARSLDLSDLLV